MRKETTYTKLVKVGFISLFIGLLLFTSIFSYEYYHREQEKTEPTLSLTLGSKPECYGLNKDLNFVENGDNIEIDLK